MELLTIGGTVGKAIFPAVAKMLIAKVNSQLNPTDLEKALREGISAAENWDKTQPFDKQLFYHCDPKTAGEILERFFKNTGVQEELEKPLAQKGTPDLTFLIAAFKEVASEHQGLKFPGHSVETWLKKFTDIYFQKTSTYLRFQITKEDYFKQLSNYFDDVKFAGIQVEGQEGEKSAQLGQIFVMPDVVEEVQRREVASFERDFALEGTPSTRQTQLLREQHQLSRLEELSSKKFSAQQLLSETNAHKFVLLGSPGSGKTTLMSYFSVMLAEKQPQKLGLSADIELLPILIRIRELARHQNISLLEYVQQFARNNLAVRQLPAGFFESWLEDGRALILLDGLDEVADSAKRYEVVKRIESFLGQYSQNRAIITSRPAGYRRDFFRTEECPHYTLQLFDELKIEEFIKRWYESRFKDSAEAQRRQESLNKALAEQERIKILAKNPLLLTIIALIHRYEAHLPRQRHKLYDRAVKTLLTAWDAGKELDYKWSLEYLNRDDIERLIQQLAYWIHTQGGMGDKEGGTLIDRSQLITQLSKFIVNQKRIEKHQAKAEAKRFIEHIRDRCGLLNEQGQDCYAFVHKTFQEYLAAEDIRYRQEDEDFEVVLNHIRKYLHDPHWREVLLLLITQQKPKKAARVLNEILLQPTLYEKWLHRNLFFAGKCLAEDIEVLDDSLVTQILHRLIELEIKDYLHVGSKIHSQVFQTLCSLYETKFAIQVLKLLKESAELLDKVRLQQYRAALGEKEEAITSLLILLQDEDFEVCYCAARALGELRNTSDLMMQALLVQLQDEDSGVRFRAAWAIAQLGNPSDSVMQVLQTMLQDENSEVRYYAAKALGELGNKLLRS